MPSPNPKERGGRQRFSLRSGIDLPRFRGMNRQEDPGAIGDDEFQQLINIRHKGTKLIEKPGLTKIHTTGLDGEVRGVFDPILHGGSGGDPEMQEVAGITDCSPTTGYGTALSRLYWLGTDPCFGYTLFHYSPDQSPAVQKIRLPQYTVGSDQTAVWGLSSDGERLLTHATVNVQTATVTRYLRELKPRHGNAPPIDILRVLHTVGASLSPTGQAGMATFFRDLYFASSCLPAALSDAILNVWKYNGLTLTLEDTVTHTGVGGGTAVSQYSVGLCTYREELIRAGAGTTGATEASGTSGWPDSIRKRTSAGSWSAISLPATVDHFAACYDNPVVYKDVCYIFGYGIMPGVDATHTGGIVLSYNGTALSVAQNTITGTNSASYVFRSPVLFNGYIYYLHTPSTDTTKVYVGRFDGSSWDNTHKNLTAQFPLAATPINVSWLVPYQGKLYAGVNSTSETSRLVASPGTSVSGTWTTVASRASDNGAIFSGAHAAGYGFVAAVL